MRTRYSTVTIILTIVMIVLTAAILLTIGSDDSLKRKMIEGILMLICLFVFTATVIVREEAGNQF